MIWSVWVGGSEVNDHSLTKDKAESVAQDWKDEGYDDVQVDWSALIDSANKLAELKIEKPVNG
jgi:hypothetical protein